MYENETVEVGEYVVKNGDGVFVRCGEMVAYAGEVVMSKASYLIANHSIDVLGLFN